MTKALVWASIILASFASSVSARVWYVKPDSTGQAINIQAGIDSCVAGDSLVVAPGVYADPGNWNLDPGGKAIVIIAEWRLNSAVTDSTVIDCQSVGGRRGFFLHSGETPETIIEGFVITGGYTLDYGNGGGIACFNAASPTIRYNTIRNCRAGGGSGIYCNESLVTISNNRIYLNYNYGGYQVGGGVLCENSSPTITDNSIFDNDAGDRYPYGGGIACMECESALIAGNRIWGNYAIDGGAIALYGSGLIVDNICHDNSPGGGIWVSSPSGRVTIKRNDIRSGYMSAGITCDSHAEIDSNIISGNLRARGDASAICAGIGCKITNNIVMRNYMDDPFEGYTVTAGDSTVFSNNTVVYNEAYKHPAGIRVGSHSIVSHNIIAHNSSSSYEPRPSGLRADSTVVIECNDVYDNFYGNYDGVPDQTGLNGNISQDPLFCDQEHDDFSLHVSSPCLPGNHPDGADCGLIGARGMGCDYVSTLLQSWFSAYAGGGVVMTWTLAEERPLSSFSIWREELPEGHSELLVNPQLSQQGLAFTFRDAEVVPGTKIRYRVELSDENGTETLFETEAITVPAMPLSLEQNYPNPFNPQTYIRYYVPSAGRVSIEVYDAAGRQVARIFNKVQERGYHIATWDGRDGKGVSMNSGVYFYRLTAGKETVSKKMVLLR